MIMKLLIAETLTDLKFVFRILSSYIQYDEKLIKGIQTSGP